MDGIDDQLRVKPYKLGLGHVVAPQPVQADRFLRADSAGKGGFSLFKKGEMQQTLGPHQQHDPAVAPRGGIIQPDHARMKEKQLVSFRYNIHGIPRRGLHRFPFSRLHERLPRPVQPFHIDRMHEVRPEKKGAFLLAALLHVRRLHHSNISTLSG